MISKFDIDKLSKSLQLDFLEFEKDIISFRRKLYLKETQMNKMKEDHQKEIDLYQQQLKEK